MKGEEGDKKVNNLEEKELEKEEQVLKKTREGLYREGGEKERREKGEESERNKVKIERKKGEEK